MSDALAVPQPVEKAENARLNALISAGARGDATIWDVVAELVNSVVFLGSSTADVKGMADAKPLFVKMGTTDCVVVGTSQAACAKFADKTPYFIALRADTLILQLQAGMGLYVEGDTDACTLHAPDIARVKGILAANQPSA